MRLLISNYNKWLSYHFSKIIRNEQFWIRNNIQFVFQIKLMHNYRFICQSTVMAYPGQPYPGQMPPGQADPLWGYFSAVAGANGQIDAQELQGCLTSSGISGTYKQFSLETCRIMISKWYCLLTNFHHITHNVFAWCDVLCQSIIWWNVQFTILPMMTSLAMMATSFIFCVCSHHNML